MRLGTENREQVYFLVGLAVVAGYVVYLNLLSRHAEAPPAPVPIPGSPGGGRPLRHSTGENQPIVRMADAPVRRRRPRRLAAGGMQAILREQSGSRGTRPTMGVLL
jgi:hypothetical protein